MAYLVERLSVMSLLLVFSCTVKSNLNNEGDDIPIRIFEDYLPTKAVAISENLVEYDVSLQTILSEVISARAEVVVLSEHRRHKPQDHPIFTQIDGRHKNKFTFIPVIHDSIWIRDYFGTFVVENGRSEESLKLIDFVYDNENGLNDTVPYQIGMNIFKSVDHVPVVIDGGNIVATQASCFIGDMVLLENKTLSRADIVSTLERKLGCYPVIVESKFLHPHIDMWIKAVSKDQVLVSEIWPESLDVEMPKEERQFAKNVQKQLEYVAKFIGKFVEVDRIPLPLPNQKTFRTYTNSLIVNNKVLVPTYNTDYLTGDRYNDYHLGEKYEVEVRKVYEKYGYSSTFINSDKLIAKGGALHCITNSIPALKKSRRRM